MLLPLMLLSSYWYSAYLIDPASGATRGLRVALVICTALMTLHIVSSWFCGGRLRHFFWPLLAPFSLATWAFRRVFLLFASPANRHSGRRPLFDRLFSDRRCEAA